MSFFSKRQILFIECNNQNLIILESCATSSTGCPCSPNHPYLILIIFLLSHTITFFFFPNLVIAVFVFVFPLLSCSCPYGPLVSQRKQL